MAALCLLITLISKAEAQDITFGFWTRSSTNSESPFDATLTLYANDAKYQCPVYPAAVDSFYSCNASETTQCNTSDVQYTLAMQIDYDYDNNLKIDRLEITGIVIAGIPLAKAGIYIASQKPYFQIRPVRSQLALAAQAGGADNTARRQRIEGRKVI